MHILVRSSVCDVAAWQLQISSMFVVCSIKNRLLHNLLLLHCTKEMAVVTNEVLVIPRIHSALSHWFTIELWRESFVQCESKRTPMQTFVHIFALKLSVDFYDVFIATVSSEFAVNWSLKIPPHWKHVPCEILIFSNWSGQQRGNRGFSYNRQICCFRLAKNVYSYVSIYWSAKT